MPDFSSQRSVSSLLFWYILICFLGLIYVSLNISYRSPYAEYDHTGFSLSGNNSTLVLEGGKLIDRKYRFVIFIITAPDHVTHRQLIRDQSWGGYPWTDKEGREITEWKYVFVVGRTEDDERNAMLADEITAFKDMVIADEIDSYRNLVKKVLWLLQYAVDTYRFDFLIKTDDDSFINIQLMDEYLSQQIKQPNHNLFYGGVILRRSKVFRRGRYGVSLEQWKEDVYPPYCSGSGYVLGFGAIVRILETYTNGMQPIFYVEDAFIGTLVYYNNDITVTPISRFYWHQKYGCTDRKAILMHYVKGEQMKTFMDRYKKGLQYC